MLIRSKQRSLLYKASLQATTLLFLKMVKFRSRGRVKKTKEKRLRPRYKSANSIEKRPYREHNYYESQWWKMIVNPDVQDPSSYKAKKFRQRFRVPFPIFLQLVVMARSLGFIDLPVSCAKVKGIPLELQILGVLRVLGRGTCFDGIEELTGGSAESHRRFFHDFIIKFSRKYYMDL
jgi:hypothetical protein